MEWVRLLDLAGTDGLALLALAELAKLKVSVDGDKLVITGPKTAGAVAKRLITHKQAVIPILNNAATDNDNTPTNAAKNVGSGNVSESSNVNFDSWGFPLEPREVVVGESPIERRWLAYAERIRRRLGVDPALWRQSPARGGCPRCHSRDYLDVPIHGGQSIRRDCKRCGRFIRFVKWYDQPKGES